MIDQDAGWSAKMSPSMDQKPLANLPSGYYQLYKAQTADEKNI